MAYRININTLHSMGSIQVNCLIACRGAERFLYVCKQNQQFQTA